MSKPVETPEFSSTYPFEHAASPFHKHSPIAAVSVEAPTDTNGNDNRIIVVQTRDREPIIVCLVPPSVTSIRNTALLR
jgi:hypothetical protein